MDGSMNVVRAGVRGAIYRPAVEADVIVALDVSLPRLPSSGPKVVEIALDRPRRVRRDPVIRAWLRGDASPAEIAGAVAAAHAGLYALEGAQLPAAQDGPDETVVERLTPREVAVLRMMADGDTNKEIAADLGISLNTVKFHVAQVLAKLGAVSRAEAVRIGIQRGLVLL
jgi:DNA-binding NarL/FixJ family response regulator